MKHKAPDHTFKKKVLETVSKIPEGKVLTYKQVAKLAGSPRAYRSVGNILNKNYDPNIPCHRVIRSDGSAGGYNRGTKNKLLKLREEGASAIKNNHTKFNNMNDQRFPEPTVAALIFNSRNEVLLVRSHKWKNKYVIPGGHIELGEKMAVALKREIKEETGLNIYDIEFFQAAEFVFGKGFWKKKHFIFLNFTARTRSEKITLDSEGQEYVWVSPEKALTLPIEPATGNFIKEYLKKNHA